MNLRQPLTKLISAARDSVGAMIVDEAGETVDWLSRSASEEDLNLLAAYLGLRMRRLGDALEEAGAGIAVHLEQDRGGLRAHVRTLANGYTLVLVQTRPALSPEARRAMSEAAAEIVHQLFPEIADD